MTWTHNGTVTTDLMQLFRAAFPVMNIKECNIESLRIQNIYFHYCNACLYYLITLNGNPPTDDVFTKI